MDLLGLWAKTISSNITAVSCMLSNNSQNKSFETGAKRWRRRPYKTPVKRPTAQLFSFSFKRGIKAKSIGVLKVRPIA